MKTTVEELQTFIAIIDKGSISAAAEELNQTPSGVSRTLARLEKKLEVTLLRRTTRKLALSDEGQNFLTHARDIIRSFENAEDAVKSKNNPSGVLRVDSATPFILHAVVSYLKEFSELYPDIKIELFSNERNIDLLEHKIDVAIRIRKLRDSSLLAMSLGASRRRVYAGPAYLKEHGTPKSIDDLKNHKLLGFTDPKDLNFWPLKNGNENSIYITPDISSSSGETLLHLTKSNVGIVCLSDFMTYKDVEKGNLVQILTNITVDSREQIHAVYHKNLPKRAQIFVKFLKGKLKDAY